MSKIAVVYWTGTGNTEEMAKAIAQGACDAGAEAKAVLVSDFSADEAGKGAFLACGHAWSWVREWRAEKDCVGRGPALVVLRLRGVP